LEPDIILVVAYGQILSEKILNIPKVGCINIHGSLLPEYRGAAPINWVIINGEKETGITFICMNSKVDDGDIIARFKVDILPNETFGGLSERLSNLSAKTINKVLNDFQNKILSQIPQNRKIATYTRKMNKKDGEINWREKSIKIYNRIRGTIPTPGAYTYYKEKKIKITQSKWISGDENQNLSHAAFSGVIVAIEKDGLLVSTGDNGLIKIIKLIPAGAKEMSAGQFVNGYKIKIENTLGE
jgi:methionyl-tRNA formyltransferase